MDNTCPICHSPVAPDAPHCPNGHPLTAVVPKITGQLAQDAKLDSFLSSSTGFDIRPLTAPVLDALPDETVIVPGSIGDFPSRTSSLNDVPELSLPAAISEAINPAAYDILAEFRLPEEDMPFMPLAVQIASDGILHVLDAGQPAAFRWIRFSPTGAVLQSQSMLRGGAGLQAPAGIALDREGHLYVADLGAGCLRRYAADGAELIIGAVHSMQGPFDVDVDEAGSLFVAESLAARIIKIDLAGTRLFSYGFPDQPVVDEEEDEEEDEDETPTETTGGAPAPDRLANPSGIALDREGNLYIADTNHQRVLKIRADGSFCGELAQGVELLFPSGLKVSDAGELYVSDLDGSRVHKFDATRQLVYSLTFDSGMTGGEFDVDAAGYLYLPSKSSQAVLKVRYVG